MRTKQKPVVAAAVGLAAVLGPLAAPVPAQAAPPETISQEQVNFTTNRSTVRGPYTTRFGVTIELRAGYYQGYQYGWARVSNGRWLKDDTIWLRIFENGSWREAYGSENEFGDGTTPTVTAGQLTRADVNYKFQACLQRPGGTPQNPDTLDCTAPW